ncbi:hypothetical protein [Acidisoma sp. C75]
MRRRWGTILVITAVLLPGVAFAGIASVMGAWSREREVVLRMLNGSHPYDQARVEAAIRVFVSKAQMTADRLSHAQGGQAFADRFRQFAHDAEIAGAASASAASFRPHFQHLMADCNACHASLN